METMVGSLAWRGIVMLLINVVILGIAGYVLYLVIKALKTYIRNNQR